MLSFGWATLVIGFMYVAGLRLLHRNRGELPPFRTRAEVTEAKPPPARLRRAVVGFSVAVVVIFVAAPFLAGSAAGLADQLGISRGFAGMVFLAFTTSLPEASVSYASVRAGAYSLAVGNLFGSNCFNMAALVPLDLVDGSGPLLARVEPELAVAALFGILLMGLALLDVLNKSERRVWIIEPGPAFMVLTYLIGLIAVFRVAH